MECCLLLKEERIRLKFKLSYTLNGVTSTDIGDVQFSCSTPSNQFILWCLQSLCRCTQLPNVMNYLGVLDASTYPSTAEWLKSLGPFMAALSTAHSVVAWQDSVTCVNSLIMWLTVDIQSVLWDCASVSSDPSVCKGSFCITQCRSVGWLKPVILSSEYCSVTLYWFFWFF